MIYFTADTHYSHRNIIKYCNRPFSSVDEMNRSLIGSINKVVKPNDILYHLGDFSFGSKKQFRDKIRCENIVLIWGNHDSYEDDDQYTFTSIHDAFTLKTNGVQIELYHYAQASWDKCHKGSFHLYGHDHATIEDMMEEKFPGRRSMDVGVDNSVKLLGEYRPFSLTEIVNILGSKPGFRQLSGHD